MMSTAGGALIVSATVAHQGIWARLCRRTPSADHDAIGSDRLVIVVLGVVAMAIACVLGDVIEALTVAYNLLVGGLVWRRGNLPGALTAIIAGGATVITFMVTDGPLANEPICYGLLASLVASVAVSVVTRSAEETVLETWRRLAGESAPAPAVAPELNAARPPPHSTAPARVRTSLKGPRCPPPSRASSDCAVNSPPSYRLVARFRMADLIFTRISVRLPGPEHHFLINPYGLSSRRSPPRTW